MSGKSELILQIKYDKLNSKYNRLYDQLTNIGLFVLASIVAYSIAYMEYCKDNNPEITIFLTKLIIPIALLILIIAPIIGALITSIVSTGLRLHILLKDEKIFE